MKKSSIFIIKTLIVCLSFLACNPQPSSKPSKIELNIENIPKVDKIQKTIKTSFDGTIIELNLD